MKKVVLAITLGLVAANVSAENIPYGHAKDAGVKKCLPAIKKITDFLIEDGNAGAHSFWNTDNPDSSAFSTVIERNFSDGTILTNVTVSPTPNGKCYVEYQKIINMNKPCIATAQGLDGAKYKAEVNKEVSILEHGVVSVYLIPNGNQCTMLRKEVITDGLKL